MNIRNLPELLDCPCCGKEAHLIATTDRTLFSYPEHSHAERFDSLWKVQCKTCGIQTPLTKFSEIALTTWNNRRVRAVSIAPQDQLDLVLAVEKLLAHVEDANDAAMKPNKYYWYSRVQRALELFKEKMQC